MLKSCSKKINKIRYNDLGKPMKPTSFTVKNLGETFYRNNPKLLSLEFIILIDELTTKTFYRFRTFEFFNI